MSPALSKALERALNLALAGGAVYVAVKFGPELKSIPGVYEVLCGLIGTLVGLPEKNPLAPLTSTPPKE